MLFQLECWPSIKKKTLYKGVSLVGVKENKNDKTARLHSIELKVANACGRKIIRHTKATHQNEMQMQMIKLTGVAFALQNSL